MGALEQLYGFRSYDDLVESPPAKEEVTLTEFLGIAWLDYELDVYPVRLGQLPEDIIEELKKKYKIKKGSK